MSNASPTCIYRHEGKMLDHTPSGAAVAAGDLVLLDHQVGIALSPIADGSLGALRIDGVFDVPKKASDGAVTAGTALWWNPSTKVASVAYATTLRYLGLAAEDTAEASTTIKVSINAGRDSDGCITIQGKSAVTGTLLVETALGGAVQSVVATQNADCVITTTTNVSVTIPTQTSTNLGDFTIKCWKPTDSSTTTLIASATATDISWQAKVLAP